MSEKEKNKLPSGKYLAYVNSSLTKGKMEVAEAVLKGKLKKEIFLVAISVIRLWQTMNYQVQYY